MTFLQCGLLMYLRPIWLGFHVAGHGGGVVELVQRVGDGQTLGGVGSRLDIVTQVAGHLLVIVLPLSFILQKQLHLSLKHLQDGLILLNYLVILSSHVLVPSDHFSILIFNHSETGEPVGLIGG